MIANAETFNYSQKILRRMGFALVFLLLGIFTNYKILKEIYFGQNWTILGTFLNGIILILFLAGILKIIHLLFKYRKEEISLAAFYHNLNIGKDNYLDGINPNSLIYSRYGQLKFMHERNYPIDHSSLASILVAEQSTFVSFPRFVHSILILTGMFGTIVSLAIALTGASDLLRSLTDTSGMGQIINGMSSAMSTTMTAMSAFLFFGYFYGKLSDCQTNILQLIEKISAIYLIPLFNHPAEQTQAKTEMLAAKLETLIYSMQQTQTNLNQTYHDLSKMIHKYLADFNSMTYGLKELDNTLKKGFRLPGEQNVQ